MFDDNLSTGIPIRNLKDKPRPGQVLIRYQIIRPNTGTILRLSRQNNAQPCIIIVVASNPVKNRLIRDIDIQVAWSARACLPVAGTGLHAFCSMSSVMFLMGRNARTGAQREIFLKTYLIFPPLIATNTYFISAPGLGLGV